MWDVRGEAQAASQTVPFFCGTPRLTAKTVTARTIGETERHRLARSHEVTAPPVSRRIPEALSSYAIVSDPIPREGTHAYEIDTRNSIVQGP